MLRILLVIAYCAIVACQGTYDQDLQKWKNERLSEVKAPYGWPSVIGLFPIKVTHSYFGGSDTNEFIIPNAPSSFGYIEKTDTAVVMNVYSNIPIEVDGLKTDSKVVMKTDRHPEGPTIANYKNFQWHIIERGDQYYLRVKDSLSAPRSALKEIPYFMPDEDYIVHARVIEHGGRPDSLTYANILGQNTTRAVAAYLSFEWEGEVHDLAAFSNDSSTYFIMVYDGTTGSTSYGGGRYFYPKKADSNGNVILDFNKLINPPCVFTPYATCPLPPKSNHLPFEIKAGEMDMHLY